MTTVIRDKIVKDHDQEFISHLTAFLDDTISTAIPLDPGPTISCLSDDFHPCSVRTPSHYSPLQIQKDLHNLVSKCQLHTHSQTCYKYWKGPPAPKECRFELDSNKHHPKTTVDFETGEIQMRVTDGLVNNFCETIIQAVRCNMDIKFIGSGQSAKAILYYITDYITKSQLTTHVAYGTLLAAVHKLQHKTLLSDSSPNTIAKCLLVKCANSLLSKQELSAPQVASYLLGFGDCYMSHSFHSLFWPAFENHIAQQESVDTNSVPSNDSDVIIENNGNGIQASGSDVMDYISHSASAAFNGLCVWDFIATTSKERSSDSIPEESGVSDCPTWGRSCNLRGFFALNHPQQHTHCLRFHDPGNRLTPVPIGRGIYHRDNIQKQEHYCRLMLTLFKPWRSLQDLKSGSDSWTEAFEAFKPSLHPYHLRVINNMQKLHECKDSRDEHYATRRIRMRGDTDHASVRQSAFDQVFQVNDSDIELLNELEDGDRACSNL